MLMVQTCAGSRAENMLLAQSTCNGEGLSNFHFIAGWILLLLSLTLPVSSLSFDCPIALDRQFINEEVCKRYTACEWTGSSCQLNHGVGYRIERDAFDNCRTTAKYGRNRRKNVHYDMQSQMIGSKKNSQVINLQSITKSNRCINQETIKMSKPANSSEETVRVRLERKLINTTMYGNDLNTLQADIDRFSCHTARITLRDAKTHRYEVPLKLEGRRGCTKEKTAYIVDYLGASAENILFKLTYANSTISIPETLIYSEQFIETHLIFDTKDVYGFGENNHDRFRHTVEDGRTWPMFARDQPPGDDPQNLYGVHPFFIGIAKQNHGHSFGVFFLNSNAMEYQFQRIQSETVLNFRTVGGILDMFFIFGSSPLDVVQRYTRLVGRPIMPAYWGLGFQLSRFGYQNTSHIQTVYERNRAAGVPQDVQYADIDYMDQRRDFTIDQTKFRQLGQLVKKLREKSVHFALIYDPAISIDFTKYPPVDQGVKQDVFVKWMNHSLVPDNQCISCSDYIVGRVWPRNRTVFPDFFKAETVRWWTEQMYTFYKKVGKPDGFWIDMNEPSNFDTNSKRQSDNLICPNNKYENPPYPTVIVREPSNTSKKISDKTICMSAKHTADGKSTQGIGVMTKSEDDNSFIHYDVHNLYGWSEFRATRQAMDYVLEGKRGILVGRSTYPGSGKWGGHWTGDNTSRWKDLHRSIVGLLEFNMFGIPYVGSDICGFNGNTSPRLCLRWTQLGAFYPFCRNHNTDDGRSQDPAVWPEVAAAAREALGLRYRLLPLLYTLLYRAQQSGAMVVRPLPFQFPREAALRGIDTQFMWGNVLMVAPVVTANESMSITDIDSDFDQVEVAFPPGGWFHLHNGSTVANTGGGVTYHKYNVPTNAMIPVFVRNGSIIVTQKNESTTHRSRQNSFEMHVFGSGHAYGELFWDDGESRHTVKSGRYHLNLYRYINSTLSMNVIRNGTCYMHDPFIRRVVFYAVEHQPRAVLIDKEEVDHSILHYDNNALILTPIQIDMARNHKIQLL